MTARDEWKRRQRRTGGIIILVIGCLVLAGGLGGLVLSSYAQTMATDPGMQLRMALTNNRVEDVAMRTAIDQGLSIGGIILGGGGILAGILLYRRNRRSPSTSE